MRRRRLERRKYPYQTRRVSSSCIVIFLFAAAVVGRAQELRAGYAKADITPVGAVMMGGFDLRGTPSDGIWGTDRMYARALVFEASGIRVAFVEADVIEIQGHDLFRRKLSEATGIPVENILLGDAHNHAAPSPNAEPKTDWDRQFADELVKATAQAVANLQPVRIAAGIGHSRIAVNRRQVKPADSDSPLTFDENDASQSFGKHKTDHPVLIHEFGGVVRLGANPMGPIDDAVQIVRIDTASGRPLAVMIHYACHGTSLGGRNSKISGEWMGRMQEFVERQFPGLGAIYLQGAAGDINPRVVGGLDGNVDNIENTWAFGEEIGSEVVRVYRGLVTRALDQTARSNRDGGDPFAPAIPRAVSGFHRNRREGSHDSGPHRRPDLDDLSRGDVQQYWEAGEGCITRHLCAHYGPHERLHRLFP